MGGKSSSSTSTKTTQNVSNQTANADASGVITGNVLQGEITYTDEFGPGVQDAFNQLINLSSDAGNLVGNAFSDLIQLTNKSVDIAASTGATAIEQVSRRVEQQEQPELSVVRDLIPVLMIGVVALAVYMVWGRK